MNDHINEKNPLQKWVVLLAILTAIFLGTTLYFGFFAKPIFNQEFVKAVVENEYLQSELDSLLSEHERIKKEYGELSEQLSEKDSVILAKAEEIKKLIDGQADYRKIKRQLERLQNIAKEYVEQIDQLYTENKQLKEENTQVKAQLTESKKEVAAIKKDKEELDQTISAAAVHQVYNIHSRAIFTKNRNNEEVMTEKANRVEQFRTTFIIGANSLIPAGPLTVYCRIAIPGTGRILMPGSGDAFAFNYQGEKLQYTAKKTINYNNIAETVTINWDLAEKDKAVKGRYIVQLYTDEQYLGETSFELK
jgi:regulator of replication initiation timing